MGTRPILYHLVLGIYLHVCHITYITPSYHIILSQQLQSVILHMGTSLTYRCVAVVTCLSYCTYRNQSNIVLWPSHMAAFYISRNRCNMSLILYTLTSLTSFCGARHMDIILYVVWWMLHVSYITYRNQCNSGVWWQLQFSFITYRNLSNIVV